MNLQNIINIILLIFLFYSCSSKTDGHDLPPRPDVFSDVQSDWNLQQDAIMGDILAEPNETINENCDERAKWIYIVDTNNALIRFKPDDLSLTVIGYLNCPAPAGQNPFSMSVDRNATAWILYADLFSVSGGTLHKASTVDASCVSTPFVPSQLGMDVFGMGFVSNSPGSEDETLFVAGGSILSIAQGSAKLAILDTQSLTLTQIGTVPQWPELTGTGLAELWGFFPESNPPAVQMINKMNGSVSNTYSLPSIDTGQTEAWAFAFWGGDFYLFLKTEVDQSTNIWKLETDDGSVSIVVPNTGYRIVGAGVSTCAPVVII